MISWVLVAPEAVSSLPVTPDTHEVLSFGTLRTMPPWKSSAYITQQSCICFILFKHCVFCAAFFARPSAGSNMAARMAMMAITTSSSIRVKASHRLARMHFVIFLCCSFFPDHNHLNSNVAACRHPFTGTPLPLKGVPPFVQFRRLNQPAEIGR